ncbi:hypothetical protein KPL70_014287 [Citrus sinensis]|nr:hypothetical protein KPL70_014287 [Citrus sinensis]
MDIPTDLVTNWKREGSTHLHLGGVQLILTLHGRKGLPVTARIVLLDTRFKQYQHVVIGTVLTTLHAGSVLLTFYPNFNMSLEDPNLPTTLTTPDKPSPDPPRLSYNAMITTVSTRQEPNLLIYGFSSEGYLVYPDKVNSHFLWDVSRSPQLQRESSFKLVPAQPKIKSCLMFSSSSQSYQESFPPFERHTDPQTKVVSQPYVQSPITTSGAPEAPKQYEAVLNWQTQNASAQNQALHHLGKKIDKVASHPFYTPPKQSTYDQFFGLSHLHNIPSVPPPKHTSPKRSKSKVKISKPPPKEDLQVPKDSPTVTPEPPKKDKAPAYQYHYQHIDSLNNDSDSTSEESLPSTEILSSSEQTSLDSKSQYADISSLLMATKIEDPSTSTPIVDTPIAEEFSDDNDNVQGSQTESVPSVPPVFEKSSKPSSSPWFTFDDIPRQKWQARHQEFAAWIDVQMTSPTAQSEGK